MVRSFLSSAAAFSRAFLGELGLLDALLELGQLVAAVLGFAQLLLDRLHLLVEVVLALGLLHLALDARADALFHLQDADLSFHEGEHLLKPRRNRRDLEQLLLVGYLQGQMRGNGIRQLRGILDLVDRNQHLGRNLLVELDVLLELRDHRAGQRLDFLAVLVALAHLAGAGDEERIDLGEFLDLGAHAAFDQHLHGAVGQLQQLQDRADRADRIHVGRARIVLGRVALGDEENLLILLHHVFERAHGLLAAHEQGHDHVREDHDVPERKDGIFREGGIFLRHRNADSDYSTGRLVPPLPPSNHLTGQDFPIGLGAPHVVISLHEPCRIAGDWRQARHNGARWAGGRPVVLLTIWWSAGAPSRPRI